MLVYVCDCVCVCYMAVLLMIRSDLRLHLSDFAHHVVYNLKIERELVRKSL